ncbi:cyanoexosortase B [Sphaerothrix gracilis]|uniref:cyanoexosortase B n=1 Tax=Sphaerothrix gracilis TaxID=3151835 RepID=UPI0031FBBB67
MHSSLKFFYTIKHHSIEAAIALLLAILYVPLIWYWIDGWLNKSISIEHEYFSYALIGFPYAAWIAWQSRHQWRNLLSNGSFWGISLLALAATFYLSTVQNLINLSFPLMLGAVVLILKGLSGLRLMRWPLLFVLLATPTELPYIIAPYLMPLQRLNATIAAFLLTQISMDVSVNQIYILVNERIVEVAPYCAGLKMLMTSLYVALMILHWTGNLQSRSKTLSLLAGAALISVVGNIVRNTLLTFFHGTGRTDWFEWLHVSWGGDVFSALLLLSVVLLMNGIDRVANSLTLSPAGSTEQDNFF